VYYVHWVPQIVGISHYCCGWYPEFGTAVNFKTRFGYPVPATTKTEPQDPKETQQKLE